MSAEDEPSPIPRQEPDANSPHAGTPPATTPRLPTQSIVVIACMAAVAVLTVLANRPQHSDTALGLSGTAALTMSVYRDGRQLLDDDTIDAHNDLRKGDRVRLHMLTPRPPWVMVQIDRGGAWEEFYSGEPPEDGWLPLSLTMNDPPEYRMRFLSCEHPPEISLERSLAREECKPTLITLGR